MKLNQIALARAGLDCKDLQDTDQVAQIALARAGPDRLRSGGFLVPQRRPVVAWCIPLEESIYATWFMNFLQMEVNAGDFQIPTEGAFIDAARNKLVERFLETAADYLFFFDSDTCPPPDAVDRLLAHRKEIVGGWYRTKKKDGQAQRITVYDYQKYDEAQAMHFYQSVQYAPDDPRAPECAMGCGHRHAQKVERHDAIATGCMLIQRSVFERLVSEKVVKPGRWFSVEEGGTEDMYFCRQVAKLRDSVPVHVDWSLHCAHIGLVKM